jgi:septal ring factor EnvC (AmiA/AmiB activator)
MPTIHSVAVTHQPMTRHSRPKGYFTMIRNLRFLLVPIVSAALFVGCERNESPPLERAEALHEKAEEKLEASHDALGEAEGSLDQVSAQLVDLKEKNVDLEKSVATLRDEKASLEEALKESREANDVLSQQLLEAQDALAKAQAALDRVGDAAREVDVGDGAPLNAP